MSPNEKLAKELEERGLERNSIADLWRRSWKSELLVALKDEHTQLCQIHARNLREFPKLTDDVTAEQERAAKLAKVTWDMLRDTREQMMAMALHPTRPKGMQPGTGGGRPRKAGDSAEPIEALEVVPRSTKQTE